MQSQMLKFYTTFQKKERKNRADYEVSTIHSHKIAPCSTESMLYVYICLCQLASGAMVCYRFLKARLKTMPTEPNYISM